MLKTVIKAEIRNISRDRMYVFFFIYPIMLGVIGYFLIPYLRDVVAPGNLLPEIVAMLLILMTGFIFGALTAFTLLDFNSANSPDARTSATTAGRTKPHTRFLKAIIRIK